MDISNKILELVKNNYNITQISYQSRFLDIGINSIEFIKIIAILETNFDIEFEDEFLNIERLPTLQNLVQYVVNLIKSEETNFDN